jgi:hypothetical protein
MIFKQTFTLPASWAPYLTKGDDSELTEKEKRIIDSFVDVNELLGCIYCDDAEWFADENDATPEAGRVKEYTFTCRDEE